MWSDKTMKYKAKTPGSYGVVPTLLLMYFSLGKDQCSNMARVFKEGISEKNGWDEEQIETFRSIMNRSELNRYLNDMEEDLFLSSEKPSSRNKPKYFRLNPAILRNPSVSDVYHRYPMPKPQFFPVRYCCPKCGTEIPISFAANEIFEIPDEQINELLVKLHEKVIARSLTGKKNNELYAPYFKKWSKIEHFDFDAFISFMKEEALELNMNEFAFMMDQYLQEIQRSKRIKDFQNSLFARYR